MAILSTVATGAMAALHGYIMVLEMFLWTGPRGRRAFKMTAEYAESTKTLAANMGLYNGFLAAGLIWSLAHPAEEVAKQIRLFNMGCIVVAGIYGGLTASRRILYVQATPAAISTAILLLGL